MDKKLRLQLIMDAAGNATKFLRGIKSETETATGSLKVTRDRIADLQRATRDVRAYRTQQEAIVSNNLALTEARKKVEQLQIQYGLAEKPTQALTNKLLRAKGEVTKLTTEQQRHIGTLRDLDQRLSAAGVATADLGRHEDRLQRETAQANTALQAQIRHVTDLGERTRRLEAARGRYDKTQQLAGTMQGAGASAIGAGGALGAPLVLAGREGVNFEDIMLDVKKVVDFDTPLQFVQMNRDVLTLSKNLGLPAEGIAQIIAAAGQAKIARHELITFGDDAGKMGVAFGIAAEDAGSKMATWRTAFGMTQDEVRGLADQINYLGDNGNATAEKISDVVTRIGPLGGIAGLAAGEVAALGSTIVGMGVQEEIAATGIKNTMLALTKGTAATKAQQIAYAALGLEAEGVAKRMQVDAGGTILDVMQRIQKLSPDRQASILTQLFGSESVAAIAPMIGRLEVLETNLQAVGDAEKYSGSMAKEFENRMSGAKSEVARSTQGLRNMAISIGTNLIPQIKAGARFVGAMSDRVRAFAEAHPAAVRVVALLVGVIAAALIVFGGLAMAVAAVLGPFALLQLTLTQAGLLFAPVIAGLTGTGAAAGGAAIGVNALLWPVLAVVAAVALLAAGAYLIYRNWGAIGPWLGRLWGGIRAVVGGAMALITGYIMNFTPLGFIIRHWGPISNFLSALWDAVKQVVGLGIDSVKLYLLAFTPLGIIVRNWGAITGFVSGLWSSISGHVSGGIQAVKTAIANFQPLNDFKAAFAGVWTFMAELPGRLMNAGADAMRGFTQGIRGQRAAVQAAASDAAGRAETGARKRLDTHSPSRVFAAIGGDVMDGLGLGIRRGATRPVMQMRAATAALAAAGAFGVGGAEFADRPALTFDDGPRLSASSAGAPSAQGQRGVTTIGSVTIQIIQQPGQSTEDLARQVANLLSRPDLGAFADDEMEDA